MIRHLEIVPEKLSDKKIYVIHDEITWKCNFSGVFGKSYVDDVLNIITSRCFTSY